MPQIIFDVTSEQEKVLKSLAGPHVRQGNNGVLLAVEILDDCEVKAYLIEFGGILTSKTLEELG